MSGQASTLDMERLRKVRALMDGAKTDGERLAAQGKAEALAVRAGLSLKEALSKLDAPAQPQPGNMFAGFDDWMEAKEPGYKAREAERRAKREAERLARCQALLRIYGSEEAVFAPTALEAALRDALAPFVEDDNSHWVYRGFSFSAGPTPEMWQAIRAAVRVPETVQEAWASYEAQEAMTDARVAFCPDYTPWEWESAWTSALEHLLDNLRSPTADGIEARLQWLDFLANRDFARGWERDKALVAALRDDFTTFKAAGMQPAPQAEPHRPAQRRAAVLDLLATAPSLSGREIARRIGCSPQTVGNLRRRQSTRSD